VVGVDIKLQPRYPFAFVQADIAHIGMTWHDGWLLSFDAIHASPPCQRFSDLAKRNGNAAEWPDLIDPTRALLRSTGLPYIIENVEGAPLIEPTMLCGTMFDLRVIRHRCSRQTFRCLPHRTASTRSFTRGTSAKRTTASSTNGLRRFK
jgi:DNA (cytosine-5)-methyltransferase 1